MATEQIAMGVELLGFAQAAKDRGRSVFLVLKCHSAALDVKKAEVVGINLARVELDVREEIIWFIALDQIAAVTVRD
ncbi:hypothetical protein [Sphingomonas asaccharolytica]|uniref:hypothetical protein n=1 Tax=Sphingomonas asaccharolytica TaxID=40681 RepID=UPI00082B1244|nr:hypothetical protein [Sphingomonas asaccharolytica]